MKIVESFMITLQEKKSLKKFKSYVFRVRNFY